MGLLEGKVAFVTGAARGQGRSHAVTLAEQGADIIAVDLCRQLDAVAYRMPTVEDLDLTAALVEKANRRVVARQCDVRDVEGLQAALQAGITELGRVDIVLANAGIFPVGGARSDELQTWQDVIDVNLSGTYNTVRVTAPRLIEQGDGGAIVLTSSQSGFSGLGGDGTAGISAYTASKHGVVGLMRSFARWLAPHNIRVNSVHPCGTVTPMVMNDAFSAFLEEHPDIAPTMTNLMPVDLVEPIDVSNAILFLVSDHARYLTGVPLPVDAGFAAK